MKEAFRHIPFFILVAALIASCTGMNDLHDSYLQNGPVVYIGHLDSLHTFPGNERVKIDYWVTDARAKEVRFFWNNKKDSICFPVMAHEPLEMQSVTFSIDEGDKVLYAYTYDSKGNRSIKFEKAVTIYGPKYEATLSGRNCTGAEVKGNSVSIKWSGASGPTETGVEILYTDMSGKQVSVFKKASTLDAGSTINNADLALPIQYRSVFVPVENAIDSFYSAYKTLKLN